MHTSRPPAGEPIAIVGYSAIMPGSPDVAAFWQALVEGRDLLTDIPPDHWLIQDYYDPDPEAPDRTYARRGAFLPKVAFDPMALGIPPMALPATDAAQLLALVAADRLLSGTKLLEGADRDRAGVFIGCAALQLQTAVGSRIGRPVWRKALLDSGLSAKDAEAACDRIAEYLVPWQLESFPGMLGNVVAGRIAKRFGLRGANFTIDAACASSLAALSVAIDDLRLGRSDLVVTGGVDTMTDPATFVCFSKTPALSPSGDCRPFDADADGTMLGEAVALFALKRLTDAEKAGDRVHAVIRGIGAATDGAEVSVFAPSRAGQELALRRAYAAAGYGPGTVGLVEAHGTGTPSGDTVEAEALRAVFTADDTSETDGRTALRCALGSVKSQIGHTKAASGAAGMLKAALALGHRVLPPTLKVRSPHPALALDDSPFYLNTTARPWFHHAEHPRRASVSSFGFGGANYHVTLEEYRPSETDPGREGPRLSARGEWLVALSADTPRRLAARCRELAAEAAKTDVAAIARRAAQEFRSTDEARLCLVVASAEDLAERLARAAERISSTPTETFAESAGAHYGVGHTSIGRLAFLFPGQGSQYVGMGTQLALHFPRFRAFWDRHGTGGLAEAVYPEPVFTAAERAARQQRLNHTTMAQPAIAGYSAALLAVLDDLGVRPDCVAGHSFGELIALHAARALDEDTLMRAARGRGAFVHEATRTPGAMLALSAGATRVRELLDLEAEGRAWIAVHNAPQQIVVAGHADAVARLAADAERAGVTATPLPSDVAFHSPLLDSVTGPLHAFLKEHPVRAPLVDVYGNTDAGRYPLDPEEIRRRLASQVAAPVLFRQMIETMYADGVRTFVEVGPGRALTGLVRRILGDRPHRVVPLDRPGPRAVGRLYRALAELSAAGLRVDLAALDDGPAPEPTDTEGGADTDATVLVDSSLYGHRYPPNPRFPVPPLPAERPATAPATGPTPHTAPTTPSTDAPGPGEMPSVPRDLAHALVQAQRDTARAHAAYLDTARKTLDALTALAGAGPSHTLVLGTPPPLVDERSQDPSAGTPLPSPRARPDRESAHEHPREPSEEPTREPSATPATVPASQRELEALVMAAISDKTGYPVELLKPHMELESDLGLDSITRARILAALRPVFPQLEIQGAAHFGPLAALRTIGEVVEYLWPLIEEAAPTPAEAAPVDPTPASVAEIRRHVWEPVPAPLPGTPMPGLGFGPLLITPDDTEVAERMADRLRQAGIATEIGTELPDNATGVIHLGGLTEPARPEEAIAVQREAFRLARAAAARQKNTGGVFVTVQDTGAAFGHTHPDPARAWLGGLAGLPRTIRREWPKTSVKAVDCHRDGRPAHEVAAALVDELLHGGADIDVALDSDDTRSVLHLTETPLTPPGEPAHILGEKPLIVVTGATGGIGRPCLLALARHHPARFLLLGRTPPDDPRIAQCLTAIRRTGSDTDYARLDILDEQALTRAVDRARAHWGPVTGLLHLAGVLADGPIEHKTDEDFDHVLTTKTLGLRHLLTATHADPLRLICAFSSIVSVTGNRGQCDYAMANETLNHVLAAERTRRPDAVVRSLLWGPWQGGMVTPDLRALLDLGGVETLPLDTGARAFVDEVLRPAPEPRVVLSTGKALHRLQGVTHGAPARP